MTQLPGILKKIKPKQIPQKNDVKDIQQKVYPPTHKPNGKFAAGNSAGGRKPGSKNKVLEETKLNEAIAKLQKLGKLPYFTEKKAIEDFRKEVYGIIDTVGLKNEDDEIKLKTARDILSYLDSKKVTQTDSKEITLIIKQGDVEKKMIKKDPGQVDAEFEVVDG